MSEAVQPLIATVRLSKVYRSGFRLRRINALTDVTMSVQPGEIYGFLGPNGAGKTTLIKILIGLARPTSGTATVFGRPPRDARVKARLGFLPEQPYFYEYLTAAEFLQLAARIAGVPQNEVAGRVNGLLRLVRMEHVATNQLRGFSRGMLQRMGIAQALIGDPELVILDEPMGGLDPVGRKEFRDIIVSLRERGKTVFFSTHILSDVEMICDRVGIIINGRIAEEGRLDDILGTTADAIEVTVRGVSGKIVKAFERIAQQSVKSGETMLLTLAREEDVDKVMAIAHETGCRIQSIVPRRATLEDYFMARIGQRRGTS